MNFTSFKILSHGRSHIGLVRDNNEDAWLLEPQNNIYILCDGMGGHSAGEVAAQETVAVFSSLLKQRHAHKPSSVAREARLLKELIQQVNRAIHTLSTKDRDLHGMGTTLCCVYFYNKSMIVAHVGDSRVYLYRNKKLSQLTADHSLVMELLELGELNNRQAKDYAYKNIITRAVGAEAEVEPTIEIYELSAGDQILMCSDGLSDLLESRDMEKILRSNLSLSHSIDRLIDSANRKGGQDNITAILMKILEH